MGRSLRLLPLLGLIMGLIVAAVAHYTSLWSYPVAAALALATDFLITKGIHIRGMMNALSGLNTPKEHINQDREANISGKSTAFIWALLLLLFKSVIYLMVIQSSLVFGIIPAAFVFSRWLCSFIVYAFPAASYGGAALIFKKNFSGQDFLFASVSALFFLAIYKTWYFWIAAAISAVLIYYFCRYSFKRTGGQNFDSYGAVVEWGAVFFSLTALILQPLTEDTLFILGVF